MVRIGYRIGLGHRGASFGIWHFEREQLLLVGDDAYLNPVLI